MRRDHPVHGRARSRVGRLVLGAGQRQRPDGDGRCARRSAGRRWRPRPGRCRPDAARHRAAAEAWRGARARRPHPAGRARRAGVTALGRTSAPVPAGGGRCRPRCGSPPISAAAGAPDTAVASGTRLHRGASERACGRWPGSCRALARRPRRTSPWPAWSAPSACSPRPAAAARARRADIPKPAGATVGDWLTCFPGFAMVTADRPGPPPAVAGPAPPRCAAPRRRATGVGLRWPDGDRRPRPLPGVTGTGSGLTYQMTQPSRRRNFGRDLDPDLAEQPTRAQARDPRRGPAGAAGGLPGRLPPVLGSGRDGTMPRRRVAAPVLDLDGPELRASPHGGRDDSGRRVLRVRRCPALQQRGGSHRRRRARRRYRKVHQPLGEGLYYAPART